MDPQQYERLVAERFEAQGYRTEQTPPTNDYGVDVFATRGDERIAVQVKMYGSSSRKVNHKTMLELHGAKDYFNCTRAVLVTDGAVLSDAMAVAEKLDIEVTVLIAEQEREPPAAPESRFTEAPAQCGATFDDIWKTYIMPLEGELLETGRGKTNQIVRVDWGGITRISSNGNRSSIEISSTHVPENEAAYWLGGCSIRPVTSCAPKGSGLRQGR